MPFPGTCWGLAITALGCVTHVSEGIASAVWLLHPPSLVVFASHLYTVCVSKGCHEAAPVLVPTSDVYLTPAEPSSYFIHSLQMRSHPLVQVGLSLTAILLPQLPSAETTGWRTTT